MSNGDTADSSQDRGGSAGGQDIGETPAIMSDKPTGDRGGGNRAGSGGEASEQQKDRVRHQQRKTERHGGMQLLLQA